MPISATVKYSVYHTMYLMDLILMTCIMTLVFFNVYLCTTAWFQVTRVDPYTRFLLPFHQTDPPSNPSQFVVILLRVIVADM